MVIWYIFSVLLCCTNLATLITREGHRPLQQIVISRVLASMRHLVINLPQDGAFKWNWFWSLMPLFQQILTQHWLAVPWMSK
jgi:hypothetical protein